MEEEKRTQNISDYIFKLNSILRWQLLCRMMNKYLWNGFISGHDEETETKIYLPSTNN